MKKNIVLIKIFCIVTTVVTHPITVITHQNSNENIKQNAHRTLTQMMELKNQINNTIDKHPAMHLIEDVQITSKKLLEELNTHGKTTFVEELIERNSKNMPILMEIQIKEIKI